VPASVPATVGLTPPLGRRRRPAETRRQPDIGEVNPLLFWAPPMPPPMM